MDHDRNQSASFWCSRTAISFYVMGAVAAFFMWEEHRAHILGTLPYLIFLACPLMHIFMHHGHGHEASHKESDSNKQERD